MSHSRISVFVAAILLLASAAPAQEAEARVNPKKQAKVYEATLQEMAGRSTNDVVDTVEGWKFEAMVAWQAEDPDAKEVAKHNRAKIKFSKKETADVFGGGGKFKVVVYRKLVGTDRTTVGAVDSSGMTAGKDYALDVNKYTVIRVVFKDDALFHFRVWPTMEESGLSGGMPFRRGGTAS